MLGLTCVSQRFNICTLVLQFFFLFQSEPMGTVNTVSDPVPSDRFHELDPEDLCTTEWSEDTPQLQIDYHCFHRNYEIKVIQNQQVQKKKCQKKAENDEIREKQRKEHKQSRIN